ncbi:MAG: YqeG family HAD IIIA-type phosphatase [Eubacterium sp.]|nr:YqeG family HAD IIIA-type phosphatase [Eubacterium sp.]
MLHIFYPDEYLDSAYDIPYESYYEKGYRGILFDIDNTLVPHDAPADERAVGLFARLHAIGFKTCLISNNKEPRVKSFADAVGCYYVYKAGKPLAKGYLKGVEEMGTQELSTLFVGDQIFTDVWGAKRAGIRALLVDPIHPKEEIQIVLKRYLEKIVMFFYLREQRKKRVEKRTHLL